MGAVLGTGDPTGEPSEEPPKPSPCSHRFSQLTTPSTPSSPADCGSFVTCGSLLPGLWVYFSSASRSESWHHLAPQPGGPRAVCSFCRYSTPLPLAGTLHSAVLQHFVDLAIYSGFRVPCPPGGLCFSYVCNHSSYLSACVFVHLGHVVFGLGQSPPLHQTPYVFISLPLYSAAKENYVGFRESSCCVKST